VSQPQRPVLPNAESPWLECGNAAERRARRTSSPESENLIKTALIKRSVDLTCGKDRLDLRSKEEVAVALRIE
jgi:hypothetical protein